MPFRYIGAATHQEFKPLHQSVPHLGRRQQPCPGRREFDRERYPFPMGDQTAYCFRVPGRDLKIGWPNLRPVREHWSGDTWEPGWGQVLAAEEPSSSSFTDDFFAGRDWKISTEQIRLQRELVTSLGSCSFDEPRDDLRALKLL